MLPSGGGRTSNLLITRWTRIQLSHIGRLILYHTLTIQLQGDEGRESELSSRSEWTIYKLCFIFSSGEKYLSSKMIVGYGRALPSLIKQHTVYYDVPSVAVLLRFKNPLL